MFAVLVNSVVVIFGSLLGIIFRKKITAEMNDIVCCAAGTVTLILGIQMAMQMENVVRITLSMMLGGITGTILDIDGKILRLGDFLGDRFKAKDGTGTFAYGFLNASVLFCVGAMTILGSVDAGVKGDYNLLYTKSILDGFMSIALCAAMGIGVIFSALAILIYQGALVLLAQNIQQFLTETMLNEISAVGGLIVVMISLGLLNVRKIKTANYLPALIYAVAAVLVMGN